MTEDEMVGWHHQPDGREFVQTPEDNENSVVWCATVQGVAKRQTQLSN